MPILSSEIKFYKSSSGVGLGGPISPTQIITGVKNNLWDDVSSSQSIHGSTEYRCMYVKNENAAIALLNALFILVSDSASADTSIEIGLGTSGVGGAEQVIPDETTAPVGVTFSALTGEANGLSLGNIPANGGYYPLWIKRIVNPGAYASSSDPSTCRVQGETTA